MAYPCTRSNTCNASSFSGLIRFDSRKRLFDFAKVLRKPATEHKVSFSTRSFIDAPLKIREVLLIDTPDFRFYNNGFILRRRIPYADGFPRASGMVWARDRSPSRISTSVMSPKPTPWARMSPTNAVVLCNGPDLAVPEGSMRDTITRFMGSIVLSMAVQFALTGLRQFGH
jgi:hypothetical protein